MATYLGSLRVCKSCEGEMVPACDVQADAPPEGSDADVSDCGWLCLVCGERTPAVLRLERSATDDRRDDPEL